MKDPTHLELLLLHAVDHVLLLVAGLLPRVVRADDVDLGGGGATLHHVHYVVSVGDVEAGDGEILIIIIIIIIGSWGGEFLIMEIPRSQWLGKFLHWVGGVPVKVGQSRDPPPL